MAFSETGLGFSCVSRSLGSVSQGWILSPETDLTITASLQPGSGSLHVEPIRITWDDFLLKTFM